MRIGIDISVLNMQKTGVGTYSHSLFKHLIKNDQENKYKIFFFSMSKKGLPRYILKDFDYPHVELIQYNLGRGILNRAWWYIPKSLGAHFYKDIDIFHFSDTISMYPNSVPTIATIYDMTPAIYPQFHTDANIHFHSLRNETIKKHAHHFVTISESSKQDIHKLLHIPQKDISVVYGAADKTFKKNIQLKEVQKTLKKYKLNYQKYFLYIGTVEPRKNLATALISFSLIQKDLAQNYKFVITGAKGWDWENIKILIKKLNLTKKVKVTGYVPDIEIPRLIKGCTAFVYPSFYEGFGLPILEAMQCAVPVVTTKTSSIPEITGSAIPLFDPKDYVSIAQYMEKLAKNTTQRNMYSEKCLQRSQLFSWDNSAQKLLDVYTHTFRKYL